MNILILTGRFGMGHIRCAETIEERIRTNNPEASVYVVDLINYLFPKFSKEIYKSFEILVSKFYNLYNFLNTAAEKYGGAPMKGVLKEKIDALVNETKPDIVVCNLPVCGQYFGSYKRLTGKKIPMYVYITDITFHNEWIAPEADLYFVGDNSTRNTLISKGIKKETIYVSGIPVSEDFSVNTETDLRDENTPHVLIMGGGLGLIPGGEQTISVLDRLSYAGVIKTTLICGNNVRLAKQAKQKYQNIEVLGYVEDVAELMKGASAVITKPGGITTFEAIKSCTPLFVVHPILEQELGNAKFIEENNIGRVIYGKEKFDESEFIRFISDRILRKSMQENMKEIEANLSEYNPIPYLLQERKWLQS